MKFHGEDVETTTITQRIGKFRVAIVGGGPGGLFTAWHLAAKAGDSCQITIFEASERAGGKIVTEQFAGIGPYEAGVAEIYDYSRLGPDPLHDLIVKDLGLDVKYIEGGPCVLDDKIFLTADDLAETFGERARDEANAFRARCAEMLSPQAYYLSVAQADNEHPWAHVSGEDLLVNTIKDDAARRYIRTMAHSDVAAPPHQTNGLTFLKNVLMDVDGYMDICSVNGGNEQIVTRLVNLLDADLRLNSNVRSVQPLDDGTYRLEMDVNDVRETAVADFVVLALPLTALSTIHWRSEALQEAVDRHSGYFDRPGHYLRATLLFRRPFWRDRLPKDWWMLDAFDGCCVYDESARYDLGGWGALAFLIAGNAALALANVDDERIEQMCLDALPPELSEARELLVDRRVHRWMASVSAIPGGLPVRARAGNHRPDPVHLPGIVMVGDYLFDATLNGVLDSAEAGTDIILSEILRRRRASAKGAATSAGSPTVAPDELIETFFSVDALADIVSVAWNVKPGGKILHVGSGAGRTVASLRALGYEAFGIESDRALWSKTAAEIAPYNRLGKLTDLPFDDRAFDVVIETGLCRLQESEAAKAIEEIRRVAKLGMVLGSTTIDLAIDFIERHNLLEGLAVLGSRWDWSEKLYAAGFTHALMDPSRLDKAWKRAVEAGAGPGSWYEDAENLLYCFYEPSSAPARTPKAGETAERAATPVPALETE